MGQGQQVVKRILINIFSYHEEFMYALEFSKSLFSESRSVMVNALFKRHATNARSVNRALSEDALPAA